MPADLLKSYLYRSISPAGGFIPNMASVGSISPVNHVQPHQNTQAAHAKPPAQKPAPPPQDTVHLSDAAKAASRDADHDGDRK